MKRLKLNIQLFGASNWGSAETSSSAGNTGTVSVSFTQDSTNTSGNYSSVTASCSFTMNSGSFNTSGSTHHLKLYWHDNHENTDKYIGEVTTTAISKGANVSYSKTFNVYHNSDGNLKGYAWASWEKTGSNTYVPNSKTASAPNTDLWGIAREFSSAPTLTLVSKTETSYTFKWQTSETCDYVRWHFDNNQNWHDVGSQNGTSGTFTVSNGDTIKNDAGVVGSITIGENTYHEVRIEAKKKDSQLWGWSDNSRNTTYSYPNISTVTYPSLSISKDSTTKQTLKVSNPLGTARKYKIRMYFNSVSDANKIYESSEISTDGNVDINISNANMYSKIPANPEGNCIYTVYCTTTGSTKQTEAGKNKFVAVKANGNTPTITSYSIKDTANQSLTGSADKMVVNLSKPAISVTANAKNSAYIKSIKVTNGSTNIVNGTYSSGASNTGSGTASSSITKESFTITIVDSRNFDYTTTVTPSYVNYVPVTVSPTFVRNQPTDGKVNLSYSGNYFNASFGSVANTLEVKWRVKEKGGSYGSWTTLSPTKSGNTYTQNVGTLSGDYDYTKDYVFNIIAIDKINTSGYSVEVNVIKGQPVFWWNTDTLYATRKLAIPKNGTAGYGLINSDGSSIIRDHGNKNVTVDATGGTLFLGFQNTTALNFINGKATMNGSGDLSCGKVNTYTLGAACAKGVKTLSAKGAITTSTANLVDCNAIAYWNGAYNTSNNSNLSYCNRGAFGTIVTKATGDYIATSGGTITGDIKSAFKHTSGQINVWSPNVYTMGYYTNSGSQYCACSTTATSGTKDWGWNIWASDKRIKHDIKPSKIKGLDIVNKFEHKQFIYNDDKDENIVKIGYVADDLKEIDEQLIFEVGADKIKQPNESYIIPVLSKAIQELSQENDELKARIELLENKFKELEELVNATN